MTTWRETVKPILFSLAMASVIWALVWSGATSIDRRAHREATASAPR